jgi:hypothetical protein
MPLKYFGFDVSGAVKAVAPIAADIEVLKERVIEILAKSNKRLVIMMDDIDRLQKSEIQAVFRLVKLSADFPNTAYILSFDQQMVSNALAEGYGEDVEAGRNFLEKIIQVSLPLPPAGIQALMSLTIEGIEEAFAMAEIQLTDAERRRFSDIFDKGFRSVLGTPRLSKRLANVLTFALPLVKGEVDIVDFVLIEAVHAFYPKLYDSIRDNAEIFRNKTLADLHSRDDEAFNNRAKQTIEESLKTLTENQKRSAALILLELFPRTQGYKLLTYPYSSDIRSDSRKRIASDEYFSRYFTYGVQPHDVSDNEVLNFLQVLTDKGKDFIVETVSIYVREDESRAKSFIGKLRQHEDQLNPEVAELLAVGLALSGEAFPKYAPIDRSLGFGVSAQATILIRKLLARIPDQAHRESVALQLAQEATPLPFAYDYWYWTRPLKDSNSEKAVSVVSAECENKLKQIVGGRIAAEAVEEPLESKYPVDAQDLYRLWFETDPDGLNAYLKQSINENPEAAVNFLAGFLLVDPTPRSEPLSVMESQSWYTLLTKILEPEIILPALKLTNPEAFEKQTADATRLMDAKQRAAEWFIRMYGTNKEGSDSDASESYGRKSS